MKTKSTKRKDDGDLQALFCMILARSENKSYENVRM